MRLIKQFFGGPHLLIGIEGTKEEIESKLMSLANFGGIGIDGRNGDRTIGCSIDKCTGEILSTFRQSSRIDGLHLGSPDTFRYVITTKEKLMGYFYTLCSLAFDPERIETVRLQSYLHSQAQSLYDAIPSESFLDYGEKYYRSHSGKGKEDKEYFGPDAIAYAKQEIRELALHPDRD